MTGLKLKRYGRQTSDGFSNLELLILVIIICILGVFVVVNYSGVKQKHRDTERKNDLLSLEEQINTYQAETDKYPTAAQLNNSKFVSANFKNFDDGSLRDPSWTSKNKFCNSGDLSQLEATTAPDKGCYGYAVSPENCDDQDVSCTSYTLTANLEAGGTYTKKSLD